MNFVFFDPWACLAEGFNAPVFDGGINLLDKSFDPDCRLRSGFKSPQGQPVIGFFQDPISYGHFTGAT